MNPRCVTEPSSRRPNVSAVLSRPEYVVVHELYRRASGRTDRDLAARTQLAMTTLHVVLAKLERRRLIELRSGGWRLTGRGRMEIRKWQASAT